MDVVNFMHQNFRAARRPPEDFVGGTLRDLSEHYDACIESPVRMPAAAQHLPKYPPGDPRNNPPGVEPRETAADVIRCETDEAA